MSVYKGLAQHYDYKGLLMDNDLDKLSFYELCSKAGFVDDVDNVDKQRLAKFFGKSERTITRLLKTGACHEMNIKLLKLQVINIKSVRGSLT